VVSEIADADYRTTPVSLLGARSGGQSSRAYAGASQDAPRIAAG